MTTPPELGVDISPTPMQKVADAQDTPCSILNTAPPGAGIFTVTHLPPLNTTANGTTKPADGLVTVDPTATQSLTEGQATPFRPLPVVPGPFAEVHFAPFQVEISANV